MALGLLLCVSWICFLLFDCSAGLPKEQGYRYKADLHNHGDDDQDDDLDFGIFDRRDFKAPDHPLISDHMSYSKPSVAQLSGWVLPSLQNLPNTQSYMQRLVNGQPRDWRRVDPAKELVFPLSRSYPLRVPAKPQPGPVHTPYPSGNTGHSSNTAGRYSNANYMNTGSSPFSTQQGSFHSNPTHVGAWSFDPFSQGSPSSGFYGGENPNFSPTNYWQQTAVVGTRRVSEPIRPLPSSSYIVQSRKGYQRGSYIQSKSRFSPEVPLRGVFRVNSRSSSYEEPLKNDVLSDETK